MKKKEKKQKKELGWIERLVINFILKRVTKYININMKGSWKTTLGGAIGALGTFLSTQHDPAWLSIVGQILIGLGMFIMGASARDNNVSSEEVGAK